MTIPGVGPLNEMAFTGSIDDPPRFRQSRDLGAYLGLVQRRHQAGEVDYFGSISIESCRLASRRQGDHFHHWAALPLIRSGSFGRLCSFIDGFLREIGEILVGLRFFQQSFLEQFSRIPHAEFLCPPTQGPIASDLIVFHSLRR